MSICENCQCEHDGSYASGRFCSSKCSRGFSTKAKRKEINEKVSEKLKGNTQGPANGFKKGYDTRRCNLSLEQKRLGGLNGSKIKSKKFLERRESDYRNLSWDSFCLKYKKWIKFYVLLEQDYSCNICSLKKWNDEYIVLEIHHKDGNKYNNKRENLECICPNCHSQTDTWKTRGGTNKYDKKSV